MRRRKSCCLAARFCLVRPTTNEKRRRSSGRGTSRSTNVFPTPEIKLENAFPKHRCVETFHIKLYSATVGYTMSKSSIGAHRSTLMEKKKSTETKRKDRSTTHCPVVEQSAVVTSLFVFPSSLRTARRLSQRAQSPPGQQTAASHAHLHLRQAPYSSAARYGSNYTTSNRATQTSSPALRTTARRRVYNNIPWPQPP